MSYTERMDNPGSSTAYTHRQLIRKLRGLAARDTDVIMSRIENGAQEDMMMGKQTESHRIGKRWYDLEDTS